MALASLTLPHPATFALPPSLSPLPPSLPPSLSPSPERPRVLRPPPQHGLHHFIVSGPREGQRARQALVRHHPQGPHVHRVRIWQAHVPGHRGAMRGLVVGVVEHHLGRHELQRAQAGDGAAAAVADGEAEVREEGVGALGGVGGAGEAV